MTSDHWAASSSRAPGRPARTSRRGAAGPAPVVAMLALIWAVFVAETVVPGVDLVSFGLIAGDPDRWWGVFTAPFLHAGLAHIVGNTMSFVVLGTLVALRSHREFYAVTVWAMIGGGALAWVLTPAGTVVVGASGLVFGYFSDIVVGALIPGGRTLGIAVRDVLIAVVVVAVYGAAMAQGILAAGPSVSWQMHLGGALGGAVAALTVRR
ncbi:MAG: rhomboid family intramembrane serine protease [Actinomyces sp.]|nr:rhomboid family intramembrane serine protease [Actinomyces sp.]MCI1640957.1 rhomboid family intramembrane serine protease [Actinomyces sp.]MCI1661325.1 rhomboid family intramembrane serine protease [Actinomyces sp.]MCI1690333.1 rhomboid family intramembrane serine protease [Actinomyces sp.]MCI1786974.1 rhomboid family intramembrane serine protease [Actinomyces sp.]MCI1829460.1 rhomboid family intramembrane serine protease [Actinomyces sp.]